MAAALSLVTRADQELLDVCIHLGSMQAEWQRLWEAAGQPADASRYDGDQNELLAPQALALRDYTRKVWPATDDPYTHVGERRTDLAHRLISLRAMTPEGVAAKAVAVLALHDAAEYSECRDDHCTLAMSLLRDVAGSARSLVGKGRA